MLRSAAIILQRSLRIVMAVKRKEQTRSLSAQNRFYPLVNLKRIQIIFFSILNTSQTAILYNKRNAGLKRACF